MKFLYLHTVLLNYAHGCAVFIGWVHFLAIMGTGKDGVSLLGVDGGILAGFFVKLYILLINVIINVKNGGAYMGLYMLKNTGKDIEDGIVEKVKSDSIDYECYFESWLENSPSLLFDDEDDGNTVLWIGRQVTASVGGCW